MRNLLGLVLLALVVVPPSIAISDGSPRGAAMKPQLLSRVGYVMLGVADLHTASEFYHGKLGLQQRTTGDDLAFFDAGPISLVVSTEVGRAPGDSEVVFAVDHVDATYEALRKAGVTFHREPHAVAGDSWAASFRDPDGHALSIFGPR